MGHMQHAANQVPIFVYGCIRGSTRKPLACCTAPPAVLVGGGSTPGFGDDDELLVRASAVLKSQGQKTGPVGDPVRKRFGSLPLHHQNICLSLFELQGQLAMSPAAGAGLRPKAF